MQVVALHEGVVQAVRTVLLCGYNSLIGTDDLVGRKFQRAV